MRFDDPRLDEVDKIDYFLANLQLAVEQGEIGRQALERMSAPYLGRRAELEASLAADPPQPSAPPVVATPVTPLATALAEPTDATAGHALPAEQPVPKRPQVVVVERPAVSEDSTRPTSPISPAAVVGTGGEIDRMFDPGAPPGAAPWASKRSSFSLGRLIAYAGASLAVVAAVVFAFRGWLRFPPIVRLAGLIAATIVLYADGEWLRKKLSLPVAGFWLMSAGAALFILDGYALLQLLNLSGPGPWAAVLLACSLGYWWTEKRVGNGIFAVAGVLMQIGFWWLLAVAAGLGAAWATALVGAAAAAWAFASARMRADGPLGALGRVLATSSVLVTFVVAIVMTFLVSSSIVNGPWIWPIAPAAVSAIGAAITFEYALRNRRELAVFAQVPIFLAVGTLWFARSAPPQFAPGLDIIAVLAVLIIADARYALRRRSVSYAVAGYIGWLMMWTGVAYELGLSYQLMLGATAGLGIASLVGAITIVRFLDKYEESERALPAHLWQVAGVMTTMSAAVGTLVLGGLPGFIAGIDPKPVPVYVLLATWTMAIIAAVWFILPRWWTAAPVLVWSFVFALHAAAFLRPEWQLSLHALVLVALAAVWSQARAHLKVVSMIPRNGGVWLARAMYIIMPLASLALLWSSGTQRSFAFAALLAVSGAAWLAEAARARTQWLFVPFPVFAISAITVAMWTSTNLQVAAITGSVAALGIAALALFGKRDRDSWSIAILASSAATATGLSPLLLGTPGLLGVDLLLGSAVWALLAWAFLIPEVVGVSVGLGVLAIAAFLAAANPAPWVTIVVLTAVAAALLAPRVVLRNSPSPEVARWTASVAAAGLFALGTLDAIGLASYTNLVIASASWSAMGAAGLGVSILMTAGYVLAWTTTERAELGLYIGLWLVVLGVLIIFDALRIDQPEAYLLPVAVYFGVVGILWSSRKEGRPVPVGSDLAVIMLGAVAPLIISLGSNNPQAIMLHGLWALSVSAVTVVVGVWLRSRLLFFGGLAVVVVDALWLTRSMILGMPLIAWVVVAAGAAVAGGVLFAARTTLIEYLRNSRLRLMSWR